MIPLIKSTFYQETKTKKLLTSFINSAKFLSFGPECEKFETSFALWQGRKECIMVNSGSSANLAMLQTLLNLGMISPGDSVGFSAVTWSTNVMPIIELGLIPVPIDVEKETLNVSPRTLQEALKKTSISVLFLTNLLGFCDDIQRIARICTSQKIVLLEDNCESLGSVYKGKKLGNFGLMSSFSFYVGHHMSTIEGGAICTNSKKIATMLRLVRAHGWDRNLSVTNQLAIRKKYNVNSTFYSRYTFYDLGYNLRPTEIAGFLGSTQLPYLDEIVEIRQKTFMSLAKSIYAKSDRYFPVSFGHMDVVSNFAVPVICKTQEIREALVSACDGTLEIRPIVGGDMTHQPFFKKYRSKSVPCPNAAYIHEHGLYFGNNPELTQKELHTILSLMCESGQIAKK